MLICTICHFETELDDVVLRTAAEHCVCLRCYGRETGSGRPMPKALRHELITSLAQLDAVQR
jgi:hypothetical protein